MIQITENEAKVLRAIATNCFNVLNYGIPSSYEDASNWVWTDCLNDAKFPSGIEGKSLSGVCGSLSKKGLIESDDCPGEESILLTEAGFDAMMKFFDNDLGKGI